MNFTDIQKSFTSHIRDPESNAAPADVEERRMRIYRDLLYKNVESFIARSFPVLRTVIPDEKWHAMMKEYFKNHLARTPLFPRMPVEFLQYLQNERESEPGDFPFMLELAHYEWVELELSLDVREISMDGINPDGDLMDGVPVLSDLIITLTYSYPVHRISPEFLPEKAPDQPVYLLIYRNLDNEIGFMEMNPVSARLIALLQNNTRRSGKELLKEIAIEMEHPDETKVLQGGLDTLKNMLNKNILLGTRT